MLRPCFFSLIAVASLACVATSCNRVDDVAERVSGRAEKALVEAGRAENTRRLDRHALGMAAGLAARDTPMALVTAASFANDVESRTAPGAGEVPVPPELASQALLGRALALAPDDPQVLAVAALQTCQSPTSPCAADGAAAKLQALEPDNALGWLAEFDREARRGNAAKAEAALARAAHATHYRDYVDTRSAAMMREVMADPTLMQESAAALAAGFDFPPEQANRMAKYIEVSWAYPDHSPMRKPMKQACDTNKDAARLADCRAVGALLDSPQAGFLTQLRASAMVARLAIGPDEKTQALQRRREHYWLLETGKLAWELDEPPAAAVDEEIAALAGGATEQARRKRVIDARQLAFPPDYRDPYDRGEIGE